jgi:hypothetical protein
MGTYTVWDLIIVGGIIGLSLRWLLGVDVRPELAALAGVAVMLLQPWTSPTAGTFFSSASLPTIFFGGGVAAAVVAAVQSINSHL